MVNYYQHHSTKHPTKFAIVSSLWYNIIMSTIKYCIEKAHSSTYAVITDKKGKVLEEITKTHTFQYKCAKKRGKEEKCFLHAEISAICRLSHQRKHIRFLHVHQMKTVLYWLLLVKYVKKLSRKPLFKLLNILPEQVVK